MIIPWFNLPDVHLAGHEAEISKPSFSLRAYANGNFQKQFATWWNRYFGSRGSMLTVKNDVYDMLNFGQFHSGYGGNILQGRYGVIYESQYILNKFSPYNADDVLKNATETVMLLAKLRDRLEAMGKFFLFVMAPSKADARCDALPWLWQFRARHSQVPPSMYSLWEKELARKNIIYVNALDLLKKKNILKDSFPDTGTHWSMLAAGLTLEEGVKRLNYAGANFQPIIIKGEKILNKDYAEERDIADLLNIKPKYHKGMSTWKYAVYQSISAELSINTFCFGDSFSQQIKKNIVQLGFSTLDTAAIIMNRIPTKEEWFQKLNKTDLLILTYTYTKLNSYRIKREVETLLNYTDDFILRNWHPYEKSGKGQWSKYHSSMEFFHNAKNDCTFSFMIKNKFRAKELCLFINKNKISQISLNTLSCPQKIIVTIPQHLLRVGLNRLEFFSNGAVSPKSISPDSADSRVLGVFCSDFKIDR